MKNKIKVFNPITEQIITLKEAAEIANLSESHLSKMLRGIIRNSTIFYIINENSESEKSGS